MGAAIFKMLGVRNALLVIGALISLFSVVMSVITMIDHKDDDYKTFWRWLQVGLRGGLIIFLFASFLAIKFKTKAGDPLCNDHEWRNIIWRTMIFNFIYLGIQVINGLIPYGSIDKNNLGWLIHIIRVVVELLNIVVAIGYGLLPCIIPILANSNSKDVDTYVKQKNFIDQTFIKLQMFIKRSKFSEGFKMLKLESNDPKRKRLAEASAAAVVAALDARDAEKENKTQPPEEAFGDRQKRRNPSKRRKKRK